MDLKEEALLGGAPERHWYYRSKLRALHRLIGPAPVASVLDVGAGSGFFARALLRDARAQAATCVDPGYSADRDESVGGRPLLFRRHVGSSEASMVLMMDVLEHVPDDSALVRDYAKKVASRTRFIVSVPAFAWLWSGHDAFLGHHRRYTLPMLRDALRRGGLAVETGCYFYAAVLPLAAATRLGRRTRTPRSQMRPAHPLVDRALGAICGLESRWFTANRLGGLTVFAVARKP